MKPSRIIKSAWKQAGKPCSLKQFARVNFTAWLENKANQKRTKGSNGLHLLGEVRRGR